VALKIAKSLWIELREHGVETYPHECCGVLVGSHEDDGSKIVSKVVRCGNTRVDSPQNRYHIAPAEIAKIQREAMMLGTDIVGFYHSHPDHPAKWSSTDLAEAHWTDCSYVITSVESGNAVLTNSFRLMGPEESKWFEDESVEFVD
jgi:proteasome lid subunit RPN8/RPN11